MFFFVDEGQGRRIRLEVKARDGSKTSRGGGGRLEEATNQLYTER